jgi:7-cyano-7-deazaguanine tRNA-ribosyltransferase
VADFEVLERDGLARLGRLATPHGFVETPALLPVVHPERLRQPWAPSELARRLGIRAVITSAYLTWRNPDLREAARREGIHGLLDFDGVVMTDSGAFQQHAYGSIEVGPEEIERFEEEIRTDIATVLDVFTEPETPHDIAEEALRTTEERARAARARRSGLLAVPVQGGAHPDLRARAARSASAGGDVLAVGGIVPLLEQYRFSELARALAAARPSLAPEAVVHLFGAGHPMVFAFCALFGADLFDSSAYQKFARRGKLLLPEGTVDLAEVREPICRCALCAEAPLPEVRGWPPEERERHLALHNLVVSVEEVARVRQAIRDGTLWELAERRAVAHPALRAGLAEAVAHGEVFEATEPESRRAFREIGPESRDRPAVRRFRHRLAIYRADRNGELLVPRLPLVPAYLGRIPTEGPGGRPLAWNVTTPLGDVPLELCEVYPVGPYLGLEEFQDRATVPSPESVGRGAAERAGIAPAPDRDWTEAWTDRQVRALLVWQYGRETADRLASRLRGERSRRTGRLRIVRSSGSPAFTVGNDGLPRPTFRGAGLLAEALPPGRHRVVVEEEATPFAREGRSVFSRFVRTADPALVPGASALVVGPHDELLAVGRLLLAPHEMGRLRRGVAVRVTSHARARDVEVEEEEGPGPAAIYPSDRSDTVP